jgi:hypothetical protein
MPLPDLTIGLVVRYEYLWHRRSVPSGGSATTGDKDRPACVVATFRRQDRSGEFVVYLPISHTPPSAEEQGIELPDDVKRKAGLDSRRQWVLVSECNLDTWPFDLRQIPDRQGVFHYGHLPPSMFRLIRDAFWHQY